MKKYFSQKRLGIFLCMIMALVCLSYGCGGGARDIILIEQKIVYASGDADAAGKIYFTSQSEPLVIIQADEEGTLPEKSTLTLKERDLEASESGEYGSVSTKVYTLTGTVEKGGVIRPLNETMKPITVTIPNRFSSDYSEFWLGFKSADALTWQYQKIPDDGVSVVTSARMGLAPAEFVIRTYRLNYVFTVFAVKPEDLIDERIESFSLTADPIKYGYVASEGTMLFSDDLKISSFITANDSYVFSNPNVIHELTFISDSNQGSSFKIDGAKTNEQIYLAPESDNKYIHKFIVDKYAPDNSEITGTLATFSFVLNLKDVSVNEFPDNFKVMTTVINHKGTMYTYEEAFKRKKNTSNEPDYCRVAMIEPNPTVNVATGTKIVLSSEKEILWDDSYASYVKLYDENNVIASVACSISSNRKEITVTPLNGLSYETTYTVALRKGIPVSAANCALGSGTFEFVTIPASFTMASIAVTEGSLYRDAYKTNSSFIIDFVKPIANVVEVENAVSVMSPEGPVQFTLAFNAEKTEATLSFRNDLKPDTHYSITMNDTVKDIENVDVAQFGVLNFTTIPNVSAEIKVPADVTDAAIDTAIGIKFSPSVDWEDSYKDLVTIVNEDNRKVDFNISYTPSTGMLTLTPLAVLQYNMNYTINIESGMMNHESNQKLGACNLYFKTNNKVPGTGTEPEHMIASISIVAEDYVNASAVPPIISLGARFVVDFKDSPRDPHQAENAVKIYSKYEEATKLSAEWNENKSKLTFTISQNMASETIRVALIGDIFDSRNVLIEPFDELRFETTAFAGEGTAESPYLVSLPMQLDLVRKNLSAHYKQVNDIDLTNYVSNITDNYESFGFLPMACLDMTAIMSMGSEEELLRMMFSGVYDGNNYKIKGFWQELPDSYIVSGLFGASYGEDSVIKNVHLDNPNGHIKASFYVGSICGMLMGGTISNCSNNVPIIASEMMAIIGGICCMCGGNIENCINNGNITGNINTQYAGGITAGFGSLTGTGDYSRVSGCVNAGDITSSGELVGGIACIGDYGEYLVTNSINKGNITNSNTSNGMAAGIFTETSNQNKIVSCVNTGDINGYYAGGLCGKLAYMAEISNSYSVGSVFAANHESGEEEAKERAGAFVVKYDFVSTIKDTFTTKDTVINNAPVAEDTLIGDPTGYSEYSGYIYSYILNTGYSDEINAKEWSSDATWLDSSKWTLSSDKLPELVLPTE